MTTLRARLSPGLLVLLGGAAAVVCLAGLKAVSSIAGPFFLALVLTVAVSPLRRRLTARGAPVWVCATVPLLVVLVALLALAAVLVVSAAQLATVLPQYQAELTDLVTDLTGDLRALGMDQAEADKAVQGIDPAGLITSVENFLTGLLGALSAALLLVILLYGMSLDAVGLSRGLTALETRRPDLVAALRGYSADTLRYLIVSTVFGLIVAVADWGVLALLGVPLPLLWGLLAFITNYIPNIGFLIGLVPPALLALLDSGPATMAWVIVAYCVLNFVIQSLIQPKFVGDAAGFGVTLTLVSLVVWTFVLGPVGAILAVPLSLLARALLVDHDPDKQWVRKLIAAES
jgi:AI-2 transport protein TqsA